MIGKLRKLASLQAVEETETAFGGRTRSWSEVATLWVDLKAVSGREGAEADQRPALSETAQALARDHPLAEPGQRLALDGVNWRLARIARETPGAMTLFLQRDV